VENVAEKVLAEGSPAAGRGPVERPADPAGAASRRIILAMAARCGSQAAGFAVRVLTLPVALAALGSEGYGHWVIALSAANYLALARLGFPAAQSRRLARAIGRGADSGWLLSSYFALDIALGAVALSLTGAIYLVLGPVLGLYEAARTFFFLGIFASVSLPFAAHAAFLQASFREAGCELAAILGALAQGIAAVLLLRIGFGLGGLVIAFGASTFVQCTVFSALIRRTAPLDALSLRRARRDAVLEVLPESTSMGLNTLSVLLFSATDAIILGAVHGSGEAARYDLSGKILQVALPFAFVLSDAFFPLIARRADSPAALRGLYRGTLNLSLAFAGWAAALYLFLGTPLLWAWTGRRGLEVPLSTALLFAGVFLLQAVTHVGALILQATGDVKAMARRSAVSAAANLCLSLLLVRRFGIDGVLAASLIATCLGNAIAIPVHLARKLAIAAGEHARPFLRLSLPFALAAGASWAFDFTDWSRGWVIGFALSLTAAYAAASWLILGRAARRASIDWLCSMTGNRPAARTGGSAQA